MALPTPLSTQVSVRNMQVVDDVCRSAFGCGGIDLAAVAIMALFGLLAVLVLAAIVHVSEASSIVEEERARIAQERDAFDDFARRVATMDATEATAAVPATGGVATVTASDTDDLERVRAAYRDTVMAVDHYEEDYGEPLAEHLAAELGDGLAYAVVDGRQFTPQVKGALLETSRGASHRRSSFLSTLATEAESLASADDDLRAIDDERDSIAAAPPTQRSWEELVADWERLGELANRVRASSRDRQDRRQALADAGAGERPDLYAYLYGRLPVTHPALADLAELAAALERQRHRVLRALTRRV